MSDSNKYGLPRSIPAGVKREVRQRCGFGCVICGAAICQYEHVNPEFHEATRHDPDRIALLCGRCHQYVTAGRWSKEKVEEGMRNPKAKQSGFSFGSFDTGPGLPQLRLCACTFVETPIIVSVYGIPVLHFQPPEGPHGPFRFNASFSDDEENRTLRIVNNVWETYVANWDVEVVGKCITIRRAPRKVVLRLRHEARGLLIVEHLDMLFQGVRLRGDKGMTQLVTGNLTLNMSKVCVRRAYPPYAGLRIEENCIIPGG